MKLKNDRTQSGESRPVLPPAPKRFRIIKLEERVAPGRINGHYNPQTKWVSRGFRPS